MCRLISGLSLSDRLGISCSGTTALIVVKAPLCPSAVMLSFVREGTGRILEEERASLLIVSADRGACTSQKHLTPPHPQLSRSLCRGLPSPHPHIHAPADSLVVLPDFSTTQHPHGRARFPMSHGYTL